MQSLAKTLILFFFALASKNCLRISLKTLIWVPPLWTGNKFIDEIYLGVFVPEKEYTKDALNFSGPFLDSISIIFVFSLSAGERQYCWIASSFVNLIISLLSSTIKTKVQSGKPTDAVINLILILSISGVKLSKYLEEGLNEIFVE